MVLEQTSPNVLKCLSGFAKNWFVIPYNLNIKTDGEEKSQFLTNFVANNKWSAGAYEKPGDESFKSNPWKFNQNGTFVTERDGHHGTWEVKDQGGRLELIMGWKNHDGWAKFQVNHIEGKGFD